MVRLLGSVLLALCLCQPSWAGTKVASVDREAIRQHVRKAVRDFRLQLPEWLKGVLVQVPEIQVQIPEIRVQLPEIQLPAIDLEMPLVVQIPPVVLPEIRIQIPKFDIQIPERLE